MTDSEEPPRAENLLDTPNLADALESDRFKNFLDHVPVGIAIADLHPTETLTYANLEFERLVGLDAAALEGKSLDDLPGLAVGDGLSLGKAIAERDDYVGCFVIITDVGQNSVDAWSNLIQDEMGKPTVRLIALADTGPRSGILLDELEKQLRDKDTMLRELQHRVSNNLQMITALIRLEARNLPDESGERFDRLAGRIGSLALLYRCLTDAPSEGVDLGVYLTQIATAVMQAHAPEGIHLDLQVDTWPASVNVAMPAGLVVNELLTNSLKHAFAGRDGGTITLHSLVEDSGCTVIIGDDGVGLPEGMSWPLPGKLSALIVQSLKQNARAKVTVESAPGAGMRVAIFFARADAAPG